jgi:hypothetical protein
MNMYALYVQKQIALYYYTFSGLALLVLWL